VNQLAGTRKQMEQANGQRGADEKLPEEMIDETLAESFPASDPPC
jgi:hypothetical protein